jgi:hypothetical protein
VSNRAIYAQIAKARGIEVNLENHHRPSVQTADLESTSRHESVGKEARSGLDKKFRVRVHSRRARLADPDGVSAKAVIDGLVQAGVLPDDSAEFIEEIRFTQETAKEDQTVIVLESD